MEAGSQSRQPMLWAALAFAGGISLASACWRPPLWWVGAAIVLVLAAAYWTRSRLLPSAVAALVAIAAVGALDLQLHDAARRIVDLGPLADGRPVVVTAHVERDGTLRPGPFGRPQQSLEVESEEITDASLPATVAVTAGIRLSIYYSRDEDEDSPSTGNRLPVFVYGQRLRFPAKLHPPRNFDNPGGWDQRAYLARQGIVALGSAKGADVELLPGFAGSRVERWRAVLRRSVVRRMNALWTPKDAPLVTAMIIGEQSLIDRQTRVDFQRTGAYHILVVSGMNVGILAFVVFWFVRRLRGSELLSTVITLAVTGVFALVTDLGPPILRGTFMLWIYLGARLLYRERHLLNSVGIAALVLLVADPRALFDASFQLTFLCVVAIAGVGMPLLERTSQPYLGALRHLDAIEYDARLAPRLAQFRLDLRMITDRLSRMLPKRVAGGIIDGLARGALEGFEVLGIAALMQVVMVLPMAVYFHRAALTTIPANTVIVPLTGVLMPVALTATALSYLSLPLARIPAALATITLHGILGTVRTLAGLRAFDLRIPSPAIPAIVAALVALALATILAGKRRALALSGLAALVAAAVLIAAFPPAPRIRRGVLEVTALDVGQGDSLFVVTPAGKTLLIDSGGPSGQASSTFDIGENVVSPYLWSRGMARLDAVVITHGHSDHMGGMRSVIANFHPRELWVGSATPTRELSELLKELQAEGSIAVRTWSAGSHLGFGGAEVQALSPERDAPSSARAANEDSLVLKLTYAGRSVLLTGDAEKRIERLLAQREAHADVLKVPHHGSATSTSPQFLAAVSPRFAVITAGKGNRFGYPRREVLARLQQAQVSTFRTDVNGAVTFYLEAEGVQVTLPNRR